MPKASATAFIARQGWLHPVEEALHNAIHKAFGEGENARRVKDFLHGTWLGHPLHVALTDVPIGAWTTAVALDALESATGRAELAAGADAAVAIGLAGAVASAVTGLTDWSAVDPPARRIGLTHGLLNLGGAALFATSLAMRRNKRREKGRAFALLGFAVATTAARLGGHLVYGEQIGADHTVGLAGPDEFTPVMPEARLGEGELRRVVANGTPVLLVRRRGRIFAMAEGCAHMGGPLSEGKLGDTTIQCPWHGSVYALEDGSVVHGPSVHPQPCLEVRVREGQITLRRKRVEEGEPEVSSRTGPKE